ncbi:cytochrome bd biosynthesis protein [Pasteurellaceae bacterium Macca]|nr:cytochrome bd biosynthesis protein [Pasteurellaceae bacterium Macca]
MIDSLYQITKKGWLTALSFILAVVMFGAILLHSNSFALHFGGKIPYLAVLVFYGMAILFIHGVGFEIRSTVWKGIFLPLIGYIIVLPPLVLLLLA